LVVLVWGFEVQGLVRPLGVVEVTRTGPFEKLVWVPTKDPENERQEIHDRRKDPHPSGSGWNGLETRWDENGNMTSKVTYKDGELVE
jgi:hypothetical protein